MSSCIKDSNYPLFSCIYEWPRQQNIIHNQNVVLFFRRNNAVSNSLRIQSRTISHWQCDTHPKAAHCTNLLTLWCKSSPKRIRIHLCNSRRSFWAYLRKWLRAKVYIKQGNNVYLAPTARHLPLNCITGFKWEIYAVGLFLVTTRAIFSLLFLSQTGELASHFSRRGTHSLPQWP